MMENKRKSRWMHKYENGGESIGRAKTGWVVETWSRWQGATSGRRLLLPYAMSGYTKAADLDAAHNDYTSVAQAIIERAKDVDREVTAGGAMVPGFRVLRSGHVVQ